MTDAEPRQNRLILPSFEGRRRLSLDPCRREDRKQHGEMSTNEDCLEQVKRLRFEPGNDESDATEQLHSSVVCDDALKTILTQETIHLCNEIISLGFTQDDTGLIVQIINNQIVHQALGIREVDRLTLQRDVFA